MTPEIELLLCAAGKPAAPETLRDLCARADWDALLPAADFHGVTMLLAQTLGSSAPARLSAAHVDNVVKSLFFASELKALLGAFEAGGVAVIALKGPALARALYPDPALRPCSDLDFLVAPAQIDDAMRVLAAQGYRRAPHLEKLSATTLQTIDCEVRLRGPRIDVDLHWAIAPPGHVLSFDPALLWRARRIEAGCPVLSREATLVFLCAHGAKHGWSRLIWLADVARLVAQDPDWTRALALADDARCARALHLGLRLAREIAGADCPEKLIDRAPIDDAVASLADTTRRRLERLPADEPDSTELTRYNATLAIAWSAKLRHYWMLIRAPTEAELQLVALPRQFFFLYYPIRILRLVAKHSRRIAALRF